MVTGGSAGPALLGFAPMPSSSRDTLFEGGLVCRQQKKGYRFSLDAVLLAGLTRVGPEDRVMDLGTGCGVVPLILAYRGRGAEKVGVELQPELAALARRNVEENGFSRSIRIEEMDFRRVKEVFPGGSFDVVTSNPPYRKVETGRVSSNPQRAVARHEIESSVEDVFAAADWLLPCGGRVSVVYPSTRLDHLLATAVKRGFSPKQLTLVHSSANGPGRLAWVECRKGGGEELWVTPPFFIYDKEGGYSRAMREFYRR